MKTSATNVNDASDDISDAEYSGRNTPAPSTNGSRAEDYETTLRLDGELSLMIHVDEGTIMGDSVGDQSLLDVGGLGLSGPLDESVLARTLERILAADQSNSSNSFQASI